MALAVPEVDPVEAPEVDSVEAPEVDPVEAPEVDPVEAPEVDPVEAPEVDPVEAPEVDPVEAPEVDPVEAPEVDPVGLAAITVDLGKLNFWTLFHTPESLDVNGDKLKPLFVEVVLTAVEVVLTAVEVVLTAVVVLPVRVFTNEVVVGDNKGMLLVLILPKSKLLAISICGAASYKASVDTFFGNSLALHNT